MNYADKIKKTTDFIRSKIAVEPESVREVQL